MARYLGPKNKRARREGEDLFFKSGVRDHKDKCKSEKVPGQHTDRRSRLSDYGIQLREKQKIKRLYGMLEKQFRNLYKSAVRQKGATGDNLMLLLEKRLDNIVYRLGFASTRAEARQLVSHCAVLVNGEVVNIPSYKVNIGDNIAVREKSRNQGRIQAAMALSQQRAACEWLSLESEAFKGTLMAQPDLAFLAADYNVNLVVELYSK